MPPRVKSHLPSCPSRRVHFHQGGAPLFQRRSPLTGCNLQVEPGFLPSTINWSPFSDIKASGKCDFFDLFSLTGHFPAVPFYIITRSCLRLSLSSCPVYLLFLSHQTTNPSLPPRPPPPFLFPLSALSLIFFSLSLILLFSHFHFLSLFLLVAPM